MRFMALIYTDEKTDFQPGQPGFDEMMTGYMAFTTEIREKGVYAGGDPLMETPRAKTVRVRGGQKMVTNGPFAETAEQLGGYYILDCSDIDEAVAYAAKIPGAAKGCVEVRPVLDMG